jgi:3-deoxy-D-manno-octulosonic-acid transferase
MILDAFMQAQAAGHCDLLIIAPRHPARGDAVAQMLMQRGVVVAQRSRGDAMPGAGVYLADTVGEMALWYALAGVTVIGGSFADKGGHTPFEPAAHGSAIVHGPQIANFAEPFAALDAAGGAVAVADGAALALALCGIDAARQAALADAARAALAAGGDVAGVLKAIRQHARGAN